MSPITQDSLKEKAKLLRKFIKLKGNVDVSHGHCLDLVSELFGYKDWNTAAASLKSKERQTSSNPDNDVKVKIKTIGDLKKALDKFDDSDEVDATYEFKLGKFLGKLEDFDHPEDTISQEFSFTLQKDIEEVVSFKLSLEHEDIASFNDGGFVGRSLN